MIKIILPVLPMNTVVPLDDGQTFCEPSIDKVCNLRPVMGSTAYQTSFFDPMS